jgi:hypothetical protein
MEPLYLKEGYFERCFVPIAILTKMFYYAHHVIHVSAKKEKARDYTRFPRPKGNNRG